MKFYNGTEVNQDYEITLLYIKKAAERHHGQSQAQLALMYLEGSGVEKNHDTAMYWIDKSINEMKLEECYRQGMVFYHRAGLENNYDIALRYLKRSSKANAYAQAQLGYMYLNGAGIDKNYEEAARWHSIVENNYIGVQDIVVVKYTIMIKVDYKIFQKYSSCIKRNWNILESLLCKRYYQTILVLSEALVYSMNMATV
jgi:hypothetical protein